MKVALKIILYMCFYQPVPPPGGVEFVACAFVSRKNREAAVSAVIDFPAFLMASFLVILLGDSIFNLSLFFIVFFVYRLLIGQNQFV